MPISNMFRGMTGEFQRQRQQRQQQQQTQQQMMADIYLTAIKEKIKAQMQAEKIKAVMQAWQSGGLEGKESIIDASGKWTVKPAKPGEEGLRRQPISPFKNLPEFLAGLKESPGFKTPQDIRGEQFQQRAGIWETARGVPPPSAAMVRAPQDVRRRALLARGQRQRLAPQFAGRPISRTATGAYSVGAPTKIKAPKYLEKLPPITNEEIITKKGFLGFGRQTELRWTPNEWKVIQNINTREDLEELRRDWMKYRAKNVDAQKIIDWFMIPTNVAGTRGKLGTL